MEQKWCKVEQVERVRERGELRAEEIVRRETRRQEVKEDRGVGFKQVVWESKGTGGSRLSNEGVGRE